MINKRIFILAENDEKLKKIKDNDFFYKINLSKLQVQHQMNCLAENRIYFSSLVEEKMNYIGFATARWNEKYKHRLENQCNIELKKNQILVADKVGKNWVKISDHLHKGMGKLLEEMSEISGLSLDCGETFYSNNYICHKDIFDDFIIYWRFIFNYFFNKYGYDFSFGPWKSSKYKSNLHPAYFYERITMLYFANRKDLEIVSAK